MLIHLVKGFYRKKDFRDVAFLYRFVSGKVLSAIGSRAAMVGVGLPCPVSSVSFRCRRNGSVAGVGKRRASVLESAYAFYDSFSPLGRSGRKVEFYAESILGDIFWNTRGGFFFLRGFIEPLGSDAAERKGFLMHRVVRHGWWNEKGEKKE